MTNFFWDLYSRFYRKLGDFTPYQELRKKILNYTQIKTDGFYLDVGCGVGLMVQNYQNVIGLDVSMAMLKIAHTINPKSIFIQSDLNNLLPFGDGLLCGAFVNNILPFVLSPKNLLMELKRTLKPGSRLVISTLRPSFNPLLVFMEHIRATSVLTVLKSLFDVILILILNLPLVVGLKFKKYQGYELLTLENLVRTCGFRVLCSDLAYANQNVLVIAERE